MRDTLAEFIMYCLLFTVGAVFGFGFAVERIQKDAIRNNVGEYVIQNKETGKSEFRWIVNTSSQENKETEKK